VSRVRWVGIDEAGYGPNLGPLVMTAVVAEGPEGCVPDLWRDLAATACRAGGDPALLWVDDSKRLYQPGKGADRLHAAAAALLAAAGQGTVATLAELFRIAGAGTLDAVELTPWLDPDAPPASPADPPAGTPLAGAPWSIVGVHAVVVGPERFNRELAGCASKATVHFGAFAHLLRTLWSDAGATPVSVRGDKHGGRTYYLEPLSGAFPGVWIDRGRESAAESRYTLRDGARRLDLTLQPRADADDGLVAVASIVSKSLRERWMAAFNAFWCRRVPGLAPTAGYPQDAARFRAAIAPHAEALGLPPERWWRRK
jgi:hypothetical protein